MKTSIATQDPHIILIDPNRLFRERIAFILRDEVKLGYQSVVAAESLTALPTITSTVDLLLINAHYLNHIHEREIFERITQKSPNITVILWVEGAVKKLSIATPLEKNIANNDLKQLQLLAKNRLNQLPPIERYLTLSRSIDRQAFIDLMSKILSPQKEDDKDALFATLTPREVEILAYLVNGDSNKEIARALLISESTVKVHVQNILKKFSVSSRVEAAVYAVRHELMN